MKLIFRFLALTFVCHWGAVDAQNAEPREFGFMFEGTFETADIVSKVDGANDTQLTAAHTWDFGVKVFTDKSWHSSGLTWERFATRAAAVADQLALEIKPRYIRNDRGVIDYAIATNRESVFFSSAITSPNFVKPFSDTLGDKLHVVILDRYVMYVFPATGGSLGEYGAQLVQRYRSTPLPVSLEIFEVTRSNFRVIGKIQHGAKPVSIERGREVTVEER